MSQQSLSCLDHVLVENFEKGTMKVKNEMQYVFSSRCWENKESNLPGQVNAVSRMNEAYAEMLRTFSSYTCFPTLERMQRFWEELWQLEQSAKQFSAVFNSLPKEEYTLSSGKRKAYIKKVKRQFEYYQQDADKLTLSLLNEVISNQEESPYVVALEVPETYFKVCSLYRLASQDIFHFCHDPEFMKRKFNEAYLSFLKSEKWQKAQKEVCTQFFDGELDAEENYQRAYDNYKKTIWWDLEYQSRDSKGGSPDESQLVLYLTSTTIYYHDNPDHRFSYHNYFYCKTMLQLLQGLSKQKKVPDSYDLPFHSPRPTSDISLSARLTLQLVFSSKLGNIANGRLAAGVTTETIRKLFVLLLVEQHGDPVMDKYQNDFWIEVQDVNATTAVNQKTEIGTFNMEPFYTVLGAIAHKEDTGLIIHSTQAEIAKAYLGDEDYETLDKEMKRRIIKAIEKGIRYNTDNRSKTNANLINGIIYDLKSPNA